MAERNSRQRRRRTRKVQEEAPVVQEQEVTEPGPKEAKSDDSSEATAVDVAGRKRSRREESKKVIKGKQLLDELFGKLEEGQAITITRVGEDEYLLHAVEAAAPTPVKVKKVRRVPREVFFTKEYSDWLAEWSEKTYEDKLAYAEEHGIEWDSNDDKGINAMRISIAVWRDELGIQKYMDGFQTVSERRNAKAQLEAGLDVEGIEL